MLIIQGSHRKLGNTGTAASILADSLNAEVLHLSDYSIAHFDYMGPTNDDFKGLIQKLVLHDQIIWATPIYWYTMSGKMKVFLDRISDLLKWDKPLGRKLRGLKMHVVSVSGHDDPPIHFTEPFILSARYLGMTYGEYIHIWGDGVQLTTESLRRMQAFSNKLNA